MSSSNLSLRPGEGRPVDDAPEAEEHARVVEVDAEHEHVHRGEELERLLERLQRAVRRPLRRVGALVGQDPEGGAHVPAPVVMR